MIDTVFRNLSAQSREKKMQLFRSHFRASGRILDIGAQLDQGKGLLLEAREAGARTVACNLDPRHLERIRDGMQGVGAIQADARKLPFPDKSFDLVFSNAVIEHVGSFDDQRRMADEIRRVGERWFVTTPNRWFPFEFHTRMPFYGWLPAGWMQRAARLCSYNHVRRRYKFGGGAPYTRLITRSELRRLFPESEVIPVRVTLWPETFVVVGPR